MWPEPFYIKSFSVGHHLCAILTLKTKTSQQQNDTQTQAPNPHTHKTICALRQILDGLNMAFLSSSHFQITHRDAKVIWPLRIADKKILCFWRDRPSCHHFGKIVIGGGTYHQKQKTFLFIFLPLKLLLSNSAHISATYTMLFK